MSVGRLRWTWRSMSSTACWSWDARTTSAWPNPGPGWGHCARIPDPCNTAAVNEIVAKRLNKRQQMRWSRASVQPFLDVRTAVLNDTLEDAFRQRYPGFRPAN